MFSVQVDIDVLAAARAVALSHTARHDADMLLKTTLTEALGERSFDRGPCIVSLARLRAFLATALFQSTK